VIREQNLIPVLLNHEGAGDEAICKQIKEMSCGHIDIINEEDPIKVKGIIGASRGIICSRFHGCVSALSQGIPCLGTSWSHKYERLFEEYLQSECLIGPTITKDQLNDTFLKSTELCQKTSCIKARNIYKSSAIDMWNQVEKVID
jgi:colanic acid/amylovoran biosynthesis protein